MNSPFSPVPLGPATVSAQQFLHGMAEAGLLTKEEVPALLARLPLPARQDVRSLAAELIRQRRLTPFQSQMIAQGRWAGLVLGNYVILDRIGAGGMGIVYKAQHRRMKRLVALKVLTPAISRSKSAVARFQREVEAAAKLNHTNIVAAHDADEAQGTHFLVMEYVQGSDLAQRVKMHGPLPAAQAIDCIWQAARGLEHAHACGMIHRDIKPSNLLLDDNGTLKILDLGLARFQETGAANATEATSRPELTETGSFMGTCEFMAPEQALNTRNADGRSDIYSLGCTLYYLIVGEPPYKGGTPMEKLLAHREDPIPPLAKGRRDVPPDLETIYRRMLAKNPSQRYQSMREVIAALESLGGTSPTAKVHGGPSNRRKRILLPVGVAVLALGALLAFVAVVGFGGRKAGEPRGEADRTKLTKQPGITEQSGPVAALMEGSPPAKQVEYVLKKLKETNPRFDGQGTHEQENGVVAELSICTDHVENISPVRSLPRLKRLKCAGSGFNKGQLRNLEPIRGLPLTELYCGYNPSIKDLSPLKGMALETLDCANTQVSDLVVLQGMPVSFLHVHDTNVRDLTPLRQLPLRQLRFDIQAAQDLTPLRSIPTLQKINGVASAEFFKKYPVSR
jgi:serine/threonine protein kinase